MMSVQKQYLLALISRRGQTQYASIHPVYVQRVNMLSNFSANHYIKAYAENCNQSTVGLFRQCVCAYPDIFPCFWIWALVASSIGITGKPTVFFRIQIIFFG